ncbi:MAG: hypothetical protein M1825_004354 [Sarcosagium campestre]|nr:MAG: hypothetical protein M1825_004354 [Sarcosagium campestre]
MAGKPKYAEGGDEAAGADRFSHVNCSYLSHSSGRAPTLLQLKEHARALTVLIRDISVTDSEFGRDTFDFLNDLDKPYENASLSHRTPLSALVNEVAEVADDATGAARLVEGCPLTADRDEQGVKYATHANEILEMLDDIYKDDGGILSLLPPENTPARESAQTTILGQWIAFTGKLVTRLAEFEVEVARYRDMFSGEALVPYHTREQHEQPSGKTLLYPQDRWVLGSLSPQLWEVIDERLRTQQVALERTDTLGVADRHFSGAAIPRLQRSAYVEVKSRIYRMGNLQSLFLLPAYDINPLTKGTQEIEQRPLVQTVAGSSRDKVGESARLRSMVKKIRSFEESNHQIIQEMQEKDAKMAAIEARIARLEWEKSMVEKKSRSLQDELEQYNEAERAKLLRREKSRADKTQSAE